jgi:putative peptide maturation dehydrogenase
VALLLRGEVKQAVYDQLCAVTPLTGREVPISPEERDLLERLPLETAIDLAELTEREAELAQRLARAGVLVGDEEEHEPLRRAHERIVDGNWNEYSALAHSMWRWRGVDAGLDEEAAPDLAGLTRAFVDRFGLPPPHFVPHREDAPALELPLVDPDERIADLLRARRTTREFDHTAPLALDALSLLLRWVWGCHGYAHLSGESVTLKKTSPSGGGLHPVEVYPLVMRVEGVEPGLYRYRPDDHALEQREPLGEDEARELASLFAARQGYLADADVLFVMTARFQRQFWKYRRHPRAYGVLLMDAAHLSQTFYLLCAELGLGAFVTAAINGADIDERLGLEPFEEGALAICGCGTPGEPVIGIDPTFRPYVPRETRL